MSTILPGDPHRRARTPLLAALLAGAVALGAGAGWASSRGPDHARVKSSDSTLVPAPVVTAVGQVAGRVPWDKPLSLQVTDGTLRSVTATDPDGKPVSGAVKDGDWSSDSTLLPASLYRMTATVLDKAGKRSEIVVETHTSLPSTTVHALLSPGDGDVVGVGFPVIVTLDRAVSNASDRATVEQRLSVITTPAVNGAWRWMSPTELHYRGANYWQRGTMITVTADFTALRLSDGTWGAGNHSTAYSIGSSVVSTVDVTKHVMTVVVDGALVRTVKVSTGRDKYPTKGGVHLVLEKTKLKIMDSATVGIPRTSPDGYYEKVPDSVRISYGGAFVHSADWSVKDQGVRNVSHGCVNISPADAAWFFQLVKRGDVVNIINAAVGPLVSDPGMSDWNIPFAVWAN